MPFRAVAILLVAAVVFALFYREQIYRWIRETLSDKKTEEKKENETTEKKDGDGAVVHRIAAGTGTEEKEKHT